MEVPWALVDRIKRPVAVLLFFGLAWRRVLDYPVYVLKPLWFFESLCFVTLGLAYVFRMPPRIRAQGPWEILFPYAVSGLPFVLAFLPGHLAVAQAGSWYLVMGRSLFPLLPVWILMIAGEGLMMGGILTLLRSFSITVEVRQVVVIGLYRIVRHPIYLGEALATAGVAILHASAASGLVLGVFLTLQYHRATLEEKKLSQASGEYAAYRNRTGMFWPRVRGPKQD